MLAPSYYPIIGGAEIDIHRLTMGLNRCGIKAEVMTFNRTEKGRPVWKLDVDQSLGYVVYRIPALHVPFCISRVTGYFLKLPLLPNPYFVPRVVKYDILHFHDDVNLTFPVLCQLVSKPKVLHLRTLAASFDSYHNNGPLKRLLGKVADIYIAMSTSTANLLRKLLIDPERIRIVHGSVDTKFFHPNEKNRSDDLILFVGRFDKLKGLHILLKALDDLRPQINLAIVGPSYEDEYSRIIRDLIAQKARTHKVAYLGGLTPNQLLPWYQRAALLVCPSLHESFGNVCIEALACATPVVASATEGILDIVRNDENGILVPPGNPLELAKAIQYLIDNPRTRERLGQRGRMIVEREFGSSVELKKLVRVYQEAILLHN